MSTVADAMKQQGEPGTGAGEDDGVDPADEQPESGDYIPPPDEDTLSILSIIPNDHDRIKGLYRRYKDPTDSSQQRQLLAYQLLRELTVHMLAEEQVVYPLVAELIEEHMREHAVDEHDSLKLFSSDLENQKVDEEGFEDKMHQLMETFLEHIHEEEHKMLHALRDVLDEPQLRELGKRFEAAKQHVPTR
jgi:hemerythrin superfamily protein